MPNSREGFEQFVRMTEALKSKQGMKDVLIGLEQGITGESWRILGKTKGMMSGS